MIIELKAFSILIDNRFLLLFIDESNDENNDKTNQQLFLFSEDEDRRVSSLLSRLANYDDAIQPIVETTDDKPVATKAKANLGVLTGVYLPCIQNIFGVIIFIRMTWMTGIINYYQLLLTNIN